MFMICFMIYQLDKSSPERPQIYLNVLQPHPHPPPNHQTGDIEAKRHYGQGGQGPGPGGGGHQHDQVQPGGHWLGVPGVQMFGLQSVVRCPIL